MIDTVLIQHGAAHEIFRGSTLDDLRSRFHADLIAQMVEVPANSVNENDIWDGAHFSPPPPPPPRTILSYEEFRARWSDAQKQALHAARAASWQIDDFVCLAQAQNNVNLTSAEGLAAKAALVSAGVLTADEADRLFTP